MSFHGGLVGVLLMVVVSRRNKKKFMDVVDCRPLVPPGLFFGRIKFHQRRAGRGYGWSHLG